MLNAFVAGSIQPLFPQRHFGHLWIVLHKRNAGPWLEQSGLGERRYDGH